MKPFYGTRKVYAKPMLRSKYLEFIHAPVEPGSEEENGYVTDWPAMWKDGSMAIGWAAKEWFEKTHQSADSLDFSHAILALKEGYKIARKGWDDSGMCLYFIPKNSCPIRKGAYITNNNEIRNGEPWTPSQSDMLADDWFILDKFDSKAWSFLD